MKKLVLAGAMAGLVFLGGSCGGSSVTPEVKKANDAQEKEEKRARREANREGLEKLVDQGGVPGAQAPAPAPAPAPPAQ